MIAKKNHCSEALIEAVFEALTKEPSTSTEVSARMGQFAGFYTTRAIRYALTDLIKQGRARRTHYRGRVCLLNQGV